MCWQYPAFTKSTFHFCWKCYYKIPLSKKWLIKSKMFSMFLLEAIRIFVLHQLFRLNTGHWTIKNLQNTIKRITWLEDRPWKKHHFFFQTPGAFFALDSVHASYHLQVNTLKFHDIIHLSVGVDKILFPYDFLLIFCALSSSSKM